MQQRNRFGVFVAPLMAMAALAWAPLRALAVDSFSVDTGQSSLSVSGTLAGAPITAQTLTAETSLVAHYNGGVGGTVTMTEMQFTQGALNASIQTPIQQPLPNGGAGASVANYGLQSDLGAAGSAVGALRNVNISLGGGTITLTGSSTNQSFDPSQLTMLFNAGDFDFNTPSAFGRLPMTGLSAANQATTAGSLIRVLSTQTLTIPIEAHFTFSTASPDDTTLIFTGKIVATRTVVPEPGAIAASFMVAGAFAMRRRNHRS